MEYNCLQCYVTFDDKPSVKRKYCNIQCRCKADGTTRTDKMRKANIGRKRSEETKDRLRKVHLGKRHNVSMEGKIAFAKNLQKARSGHTSQSYIKMVEARRKNNHHLHTAQAKELMSIKRKGITLEERVGQDRAIIIKKKISKALKGRLKKEGFGEKVRLRVIGNQNKLGWKMPDDVKKKIGDANKGRKYSKEIVEAMRLRALEYWQDLTEEQRQNHVTKVLNAQYPFPTSLEQHCINVFKANNIPLDYTGDGLYKGKNFAIAGCYPDFINITNKVVVEVYACFHKIKQYGSVQAYQEKRKNRMRGWHVYFFDENQILSKEFVDTVQSISLKKQTVETK
jgi:hypothetical protein